MENQTYQEIVGIAKSNGWQEDQIQLLKSAYDAGVMACAEHWDAALKNAIPAAGTFRQPLERLYRRTEDIRKESKSYNAKTKR